MTQLAKMQKNNSQVHAKLWKVDTTTRMVFGWAQVCKEGGEDYYDSDNQCIPEEVAYAGWNEFMKTSKVHKAMHDGDPIGEVIYAFPLLSDVVKSLGIDTGGKTGYITGVYVADDTTLQKFADGIYKGFSIGGGAIWEDVE